MTEKQLELNNIMYDNLKRSAVSKEHPPESLDKSLVPEGVIANLAFDQRGSLERETAKIYKEVYNREPNDLEIASLISDFKRLSVGMLGEYASSVLLDASYGRHKDENGRTAISIVRSLDKGTHPALLLALEETGMFPGPNGGMITRFLRGWSVSQMKYYGAVGSKLLVSYSPTDADEGFQRKQILDFLRRSHEERLVPFFEYLRLPKKGEDKKSLEYEKARPNRVLDNDKLFASVPFSEYFFIHKTEMPVDLRYVENTEPYERTKRENPEHRALWTLEQAREFFLMQDEILKNRIYIWLSAASPAFYEGVDFGLEAGARSSGVLCGRASFLGGLRPYIEGCYREDRKAGRERLQEWLDDYGRKNMKTLNKILTRAHPWFSKYGQGVCLTGELE